MELAVLVLLGIAGLIGYSIGNKNKKELSDRLWKRVWEVEHNAEAERKRAQDLLDKEQDRADKFAKQVKEAENALEAKKRHFDEQTKEAERALEIKKQQFDKQTKIAERALEAKQQHLDARDSAFKIGMSTGRNWLADLIAEAECELDKRAEIYLRTKKPPAGKAADVVKQVREEKRDVNHKLKFLEYQLRSYEEYFPFLEDYKDAILDERIPLSAETDNVAAIENTDPVQLFLDKAEYDKLPSADRNQRALERYLAKPKTNWEIGRLYERYLGYFYEKKGWRVTYEGAIKGFEDFGRDLICFKENRIKIVQAKYWRQERVVREKHVFQLFGTACLHKRQHPNDLVQAVLCSTTQLSEEALQVASLLQVTIRAIQFDRDYPMIKCNVNPGTRDKIYHLPFDQQYDRAVIGNQPGEFYAKTAQEAEEKGFRRAWRYRGPQNQ